MNFISNKQLTKFLQKRPHADVKSFNLFEVIGFQRCMLSKTICAKNLRKLIQTDKTDTDRDGLMKTNLCKSTTSFPLVDP